MTNVVNFPTPNERARVPVIVNGRQSGDIAAEALSVAAEVTPPRLAFVGHTLHRVIHHPDGRASFGALNASTLEAVLSPLIRWVNEGKDGALKDAAAPERALRVALGFTSPEEVAEMLLPGSPTPPTVTGITYAPFLRPDGSVGTTEGVDPATGTLLLPRVDFSEHLIPEHPDREQAVAAAIRVVDELLRDFPLQTDTDVAHALAFLLTPGLRSVVGLAPMFDLDASTPGSGKGLMVDVVSMVWAGTPCSSVMLTGSQDEDRKLVTALFASGAQVVRFDEVERLQGVALQKLVTDVEWSDRVLGASTLVHYPNRITWSATGNNKEVKGDMTRRVVRVRMVPDQAKPHLRADFRHPDLLGWVAENRAMILSDLLTMARSWVVAGKPPAPHGRTMGSFTTWAEVVGGILAWAGVEGFLDAEDEEAELGDHEEAEDFIAAMAACFPAGYRFTAAEVLAKVDGMAMLDSERQLRDTFPTIVSWRSSKVGIPRAQALGEWLFTHRERWYGDHRLETRGWAHGKRRAWVVLSRHGEGPAEGAEEAGEGSIGEVPW